MDETGMMALYYVFEIIPVILLTVLLLKNDHLRKRDTIEGKRIFHIASFTRRTKIWI